ncbi:MAG: hypothetical protein K8T91_13895 [Planctomycetes bacterium]|nr:hypothetical protein [Planctomycetota bacterium]
MSDSTSFSYCCPGETQGITRAVHLGRLASFYPACRDCPHSGDTRTLSPRHVRHLESAQRRARPASLFHDEGIAGTFLNELGPAEARRAATALAVLLARDMHPDTALEVMLGCDGRPIVAEIGAAVSDALRQAGCVVVDAGFTTAGAVADAIGRLDCGGGVFVGRGDAGPQQISLSFFGPQAVPLSAGGGLDELERLWHEGAERPSRRSGSIRRHRADAALIAELTPHFHALRPLRFVLDSTSLPIKQQLARLAQRVSLEIIPAGTSNSSGASEVMQQVCQVGAHFGLRIDGDGVNCRLFDEQGQEVPAERLAILVLRYYQEKSPERALVVEQPAFQAARAALGREARLHVAPISREGVARAMLAGDAVAGGGVSGRNWFASPTPVACALRTLAVLLTVLSRSDRPVSEVCYE